MGGYEDGAELQAAAQLDLTFDVKMLVVVVQGSSFFVQLGQGVAVTVADEHGLHILSKIRIAARRQLFCLLL